MFWDTFKIVSLWHTPFLRKWRKSLRTYERTLISKNLKNITAAKKNHQRERTSSSRGHHTTTNRPLKELNSSSCCLQRGLKCYPKMVTIEAIFMMIQVKTGDIPTPTKLWAVILTPQNISTNFPHRNSKIYILKLF